MSLIWTGVSGFLALECCAFLLLIILPMAWKKNLVVRIVSSEKMKTVGRALWVIAAVLGVLFYDSLREAQLRAAEHEAYKTMATSLGKDQQVTAKMFRSQRNAYMTFSALFLLLVLNSTISIIAALVKENQTTTAAAAARRDGEHED